MNTDKFNRITIYVGFGLITFAMLSFEIIMNRLFSLMYWYHFAFMIISIALFGIGFGSMLVFFFSKIFKKVLIHISILSAFLLALSLPYILVLVNSIPLKMDLVGVDHIQNMLFIKVFLVLSSPFVLTGFISASLFKLYREKINKLYFFDLAGGGLGCLFTLLIFPHHGPFYTAFILGVIIAFGACLLLFHLNKLISIPLFILIVLFHFHFTIPSVTDITPMVNKSIRHTDIGDKKKFTKALEKLYGKIVFTDWDNSGYVTVHSNNPNRLLIIADYSCFSDLNKVDKTKDIKSLNLPFYVDNLYPYMTKRFLKTWV